MIIKTWDKTLEGNYYEIVLSTKARDRKVEKVRKIIHGAVVELNRQRNIDSYPPERFFCKYCEKDIYYIESQDRFYCEKCRRNRYHSDVKRVIDNKKHKPAIP